MSNLNLLNSPSSKTAPIPISPAPGLPLRNNNVVPWWTFEDGICTFSPPLNEQQDYTVFRNNWPILNHKSDVLLTAFNEFSAPSNFTNSPKCDIFVENNIGSGGKDQQHTNNGIFWNGFSSNQIVNNEETGSNNAANFLDENSTSLSSSLGSSASSFGLSRTWQDEFFNFTNDHFLPHNDDEDLHRVQDPELSQIIDRASKIPSPVAISSNDKSSVKEIFDEIYRECEQHVVVKQQDQTVDLSNVTSGCQIELSNIVEIDIDQEIIDFCPKSLKISTRSSEIFDDDDDASSVGDFSEVGQAGDDEADDDSSCCLSSSPGAANSGGIGDDRKKYQNRKAASRYRTKRKQLRRTLATERERLEKENRRLKTNVEDVERELAYLKNILQEIRRKAQK